MTDSQAQAYDPELAKKERVFRYSGKRWILHLFLTRARSTGFGAENFNESGTGPHGPWKRWNVRLNFGRGSFQVMRFPRSTR